MMARTQITLESETQRQARQRANDLGISLAEYVRQLIVRDLGGGLAKADPAPVFDLGRSAGSNIARDKDVMIAEAFAATGAGTRAR
ncbi:MAG: hypothetical protein ABSF98_20975 [Bryobacteraceae bacterium]|jgi:hypothetical protein